MLVKLGPIIGDASGRLGTVIAARNRGGAYLRNGTKPLTSTTEYALAAKARLGLLSVAWQGLSSSQRSAWAALAQESPVTNRLGETRFLTGHQIYIKLNNIILNAGGVQIDDPPLGTAPDALLTMTIVCDLNLDAFDITFATSPLAANTKLYIWACLVDSAGINFVKNYLRFIGVSAVEETTAFDFYALFFARFGRPVEDQIVHVQVQVVNSTTGHISGPICHSCLVTDTTP